MSLHPFFLIIYFANLSRGLYLESTTWLSSIDKAPNHTIVLKNKTKSIVHKKVVTDKIKFVKEIKKYNFLTPVKIIGIN